MMVELLANGGDVFEFIYVYLHMLVSNSDSSSFSRHLSQCLPAHPTYPKNYSVMFFSIFFSVAIEPWLPIIDVLKTLGDSY